MTRRTGVLAAGVSPSSRSTKMMTRTSFITMMSLIVAVVGCCCSQHAVAFTTARRAQQASFVALTPPKTATTASAAPWPTTSAGGAMTPYVTLADRTTHSSLPPATRATTVALFAAKGEGGGKRKKRRRRKTPPPPSSSTAASTADPAEPKASSSAASANEPLVPPPPTTSAASAVLDEDAKIAAAAARAGFEFESPDAVPSGDKSPEDFLNLLDSRDFLAKKREAAEAQALEKSKRSKRKKIKRSDIEAYTKLLELDPLADDDASYFEDEKYGATSAWLGEGTKPFLGIASGPLQVGHFVGALGIVLMAFIEYPGFPLTNLPTPLRDALQGGLATIYAINAVLAVLASFTAPSRGQSSGLWAAKTFAVGAIAYDQLIQLPKTTTTEEDE